MWGAGKWQDLEKNASGGHHKGILTPIKCAIDIYRDICTLHCSTDVIKRWYGLACAFHKTLLALLHECVIGNEACLFMGPTPAV